METLGNKTFAFARECACSIYNCCDIRRSDREYNAVRDRYMAEKVQWFVDHGDGSVIFINGHNGHIGKVNLQLMTASAGCWRSRWAADTLPSARTR